MKLRRLVRALVSAVAVLLATSSGWSQTWFSTSTKDLTPLLSNATLIGSLPGWTPMRIAVGLAVPDPKALDQYIRAINDPHNSLYGSSLTPDQFVATYGPSSTQVEAVVNYLSANGFSNIQAAQNHLLVTANGTAAQASAAFNASLGQFRRNGQIIYANLTDAQVPASLSGTVAAVLGLNNISAMAPPLQTQSISILPPASLHSYTPQDFWTAYDVRSTPSAIDADIAIFAEGDLTQVLADLRFAERVNQLPQVPVQVIQVGDASSDTSFTHEWDQDTQLSTGMAGAVRTLFIYVTPSLSELDLALAFNQFVTQPAAKAGSASFGQCEEVPFLDGTMVIDDQIFRQAVAQGQTLFFSTGDNGSACPSTAPTNGVPLAGAAGAVLYPASSPYVVAVGGTTLITDANGNYVREVGWDAGGGGTSAFEISPVWQLPVAPVGAVGRGVPDISMDADPVSGGIVYAYCTQGADPASCRTNAGGTSMSSPLALGVWARLESSHGNQLGFAAPRLYLNARPLPDLISGPGFHDIVGGCNGLFCATPGYDYVTGLGTFDVNVMTSVIK
jgi:pseudomonalisin